MPRRTPDEQVGPPPTDSAQARPGGRTARVGRAVMDATIAELSEVGYTALRIEAVAERAGVNRATIYRRWGDKPNLVSAAFVERQEDVSPPADTGSVREDLLALFREIRRGFDSPWIAALIRELGPRTPQNDGVHEVLDKVWPQRFRHSREIFLRGMRRGELVDDLDPDYLVQAAAGPLYFRWLMLGEPLTDEFLERTADFVLSGVRRR
ncbi:TetR/AcrR family transcriptional regulator [Micromonospora sp. WMMD812]|uniref:TetR/AcrR family transcriptional regulator n=1 Tax=Micromonospora sp. WMMD812 TaxID=3015152 RepID=UPI00248AEA6F|nr:TetR/AcrR family transcriptional regulator [Micromonospora sp. WMMD812]WBB70068.1 TetR/AcrR family transcriptional regulator [Micromonospora sp. WMMD812]